MFAQVFVVHTTPSPRETHPRRDPNEESPESRRLFGAVWGAAAVRLPHFAPAYSPRKTWQSQYDHAKAHPRRKPHEESPESQWLFGAGLGARSPQRTPRGKHYKANAVTQKRTLPRRRLCSPRPFVLRVPPSLRSPSGSPPENAQARSEPGNPDNRIDDSRTHEWRSRPTAE